MNSPSLIKNSHHSVLAHKSYRALLSSHIRFSPTCFSTRYLSSWSRLNASPRQVSSPHSTTKISLIRHYSSQKKQQQHNSKKTGERLELQFPKSDIGNWYENVVTSANLIDYFSISGFYVLKPYAYEIWETIQDEFSKKIKRDGVKNCYFPTLVPQSNLEKETSHVEGFSPEVAWVTHSGDKELSEKLALRPTSETVMYPVIKNWIRSYRDLPVKVNQWCNVVRWEMKNPVPFLRSREFLWQEGHTVFATRKEAEEEVLQILKYYQEVYEDLLAIPVIPGRKSESEKFAGADYTTTIEAFVDVNGRSIQGATSHHLGNNFSKMFDITYTDESNQPALTYQNSWGLSTRTIGAMILIHGDDHGMVLPPRLAPIQVVIIPILKSGNEETNAAILSKGEELKQSLLAQGLRAHFDDRLDKSVRHKKVRSEIKGIPVIMELGARDIQNESCMVCRRDNIVNGRMEKAKVELTNVVDHVHGLMSDIHQNMYNRAKSKRSIKYVTEWEDFISSISAKRQVMAPFCGSVECEQQIQQDSHHDFITHEKEHHEGGLTGKAKTLCIPFESRISSGENSELGDSDPSTHQCIGTNCSHAGKHWALFGRSY